MGRVTQFISFINLDRKKLKLGQNLSSKDSDFYYTHITNLTKDNLKDFSCINLCRQHHSERHNIGNVRFEDKYSINLYKEAFYLLRKYFTE